MYAYGPLRPNMTSSIQPEVHNVAQCRQRRTEPQPSGICIQNFVLIGPAVPEICLWTDRCRDRRVDDNTPQPHRGRVMMHWRKCPLSSKDMSTVSITDGWLCRLHTMTESSHCSHCVTSSVRRGYRAAASLHQHCVRKLNKMTDNCEKCWNEMITERKQFAVKHDSEPKFSIRCQNRTTQMLGEVVCDNDYIT